MQKKTKKTLPLALTKEDLRLLTPRDLSMAHGGGGETNRTCTHCSDG
jgi:hypothetical protein